MSRVTFNSEELSSHASSDDRVEFVESPYCRNRGARGAITGLLLGAGLWAGILLLAGVIKL